MFVPYHQRQESYTPEISPVELVTPQSYTGSNRVLSFEQARSAHGRFQSGGQRSPREGRVSTGGAGAAVVSCDVNALVAVVALSDTARLPVQCELAASGHRVLLATRKPSSTGLHGTPWTPPDDLHDLRGDVRNTQSSASSSPGPYPAGISRSRATGRRPRLGVPTTPGEFIDHPSDTAGDGRLDAVRRELSVTRCAQPTGTGRPNITD